MGKNCYIVWCQSQQKTALVLWRGVQEYTIFFYYSFIYKRTKNSNHLLLYSEAKKRLQRTNLNESYYRSNMVRRLYLRSNAFWWGLNGVIHSWFSKFLAIFLPPFPLWTNFMSVSYQCFYQRFLSISKQSEKFLGLFNYNLTRSHSIIIRWIFFFNIACN